MEHEAEKGGYFILVKEGWRLDMNKRKKERKKRRRGVMGEIPTSDMILVMSCCRTQIWVMGLDEKEKVIRVKETELSENMTAANVSGTSN